MILTPKITSAHNATKNKISMNFALPVDLTTPSTTPTYSPAPTAKFTHYIKSATEIHRNNYASQPQLDITTMNFTMPADITSSVRDNKPATYSTPPATKLTRDMKSPTEIQRNDYASQPQLDINAFKMAQELAPETTRY